MFAIAFLRPSPDEPEFPDINVRHQPSASKPEGPAEPRVFLIASLTISESILSYIAGCTFWTSSVSISLDASDALGYFLRSTSNVSFVSGSISSLFEFSKSFGALLIFTSSINQENRVVFLYELWFFAVTLNSLSWIVLSSQVISLFAHLSTS